MSGEKAASIIRDRLSANGCKELAATIMRAGSLFVAKEKAVGSVNMPFGRMGEILIILTCELLQLRGI